jgi:hypothetical protein
VIRETRRKPESSLVRSFRARRIPMGGGLISVG